MSFADLAAAAQLSVMDYLSEVSWAEFAEAKAWYARVKSRPAFRPLLADRLPGFNPPDAYANLDF
jgi:glutathione S-transferase